MKHRFWSAVVSVMCLSPILLACGSNSDEREGASEAALCNQPDPEDCHPPPPPPPHPPTPKPNLLLEKLSSDCYGDVTYRVTNAGTASAGAFSVDEWRYSGTVLIRHPIMAGLVPGGSIVFTDPLDIFPAGEGSYWLIADSLHQVAESNENDNEFVSACIQ